MIRKQDPEKPPPQTGFLNAQDILMDAPIGIFASTPEGRFLSVNPAMAGMYGYGTAREMIESVTDVATQIYADPADRRHFFEFFDGVDSVKDFESLHRRKDGSTFWISESVHLVRGEKGNITHLHGFITDITARKNAEQAEKESEERFRQMFTNAPMPYQSLDEQGNFLDVNQTFVDVLGYSREELIGKNFGDILHPDWRDHFRENFPKFKAVGEILGVEFELIKKDGSAILVNFSGKIQRDDQGRFLRTHCIFQDVTGKKRTEEALQFKDQIIEAASAAVCACDMEGNMLCVNPWFLRAWGFKNAEQVLGRPFQEFWMVRERLDEVIYVLRQEGQWSAEIKARRKDGSLFDVLVTASLVLDSAGNPIAYMSTSVDITERRRAEQERDELQGQLFQAQKMESVGILAGGLTHEFNNLLHAMRGNVELISKNEFLDSQVRTRLQTVTKSMDKATQLVQQLLLFSRKTEFRKLRVDLNQEVEDVARILEQVIPRMIALELDNDPSVWFVAGDPVQIELILLNLAYNAMEAMPEGGRLTIKTGNMELDEDFVRTHPGAAIGRHVCLAVSDTGCGMDEKTLKHVFDPFFTTKEAGKGTGLGLATVYGIVKAHGGYIDCRSEPGSGTTLSIYLPLGGQENLATVEPPPKISPRGGSETILVVDDDQEIRELTQEVLESLGYSVKKAATGEEALEIYRENGKAVDLILLDLNMPGMGGYKCLQELLQHDPRVKVIIASGYAAISHGRDALSSGARGFLGKPFQLNELAVMVRQVLDEKDAATPQG